MKVNIGIDENNRRGSADLLSVLLSDIALLYQKTRNYHWNVIGEHFGSLHKLFEYQYGTLADEIDSVAERIRSLGFKSVGTFTEFLKLSRLKEHVGAFPDSRTMTLHLLEDHESIIRSLRSDAQMIQDNFHDDGTNDFLIGLLEIHEKMAWFLRAHLE